MLYFESDYMEGAHEKVLQKIIETNMESLSGYGNDHYTEEAKRKIQEACGCADADVYFLVGGTQTNSTIIATMLHDYEGVVSATTGHVAAHESGAVEYTGHKVLTIPGHDGKIDATELKALIQDFFGDANHEHMVFPGMVYVSHPTEYGTLYTKQELESIHAICKEYDIPLFLDGARLGYGLMGEGTDVTLKDIAALTDVFYIGGTKVGALCGEAVVFPNHNAPKHFQTMVKQHGALLAKGRLTGVQFDALFTDDLYYEISKHAVDMAVRMKEGLTEKGVNFFLKSPTNQQFVILSNDQMADLKEKVAYGFWEKYDDTHTVVRFATSWSTTPESVEQLIALF